MTEEEEPKARIQILSNGDKHWLLGDDLHRDDGPAIECVNGTQMWYRHGKRHRADGPAIEGGPDGWKHWYIDGDHRRIARPNGAEEWFLNGFYHREDGPAIIRADSSPGLYFLHGQQWPEGDAICKARARDAARKEAADGVHQGLVAPVNIPPPLRPRKSGMGRPFA